jgi:hypothetical protein
MTDRSNTGKASRQASQTPVDAPTATQPPIGGATTQADPPGGAVVGGIISTDAPTSNFGTLGWFTVTDEGCTVTFGIEQQGYFLSREHANYNALYSLLLAAKLNGLKVKFTYRSPRLTPAAGLAEEDAPHYVLSVVAI